MPKLAALRDKLVGNSPRIAPEDFLVLAAHAAGVPASVLLAHPERELSEEAAAKLSALAKRRAGNEPVAYLIGSKEFYGRRFRVGPQVLIPRPETEVLIEDALSCASRILTNGQPLCCIDVGTGSGAVIVTLACELSRSFPDRGIRFIGSDTSAEALDIARENAGRLAPGVPIEFFQGSLTQAGPIRDLLGEETPVLLTANLPYLSETLYRTSMPDVRNFEPRLALVSGPDGLDHYRALFTELESVRAPLTLLSEISPEQAAGIEAIVRERFPHASTGILPDLAGRLRVFRIEFR